MCESAKQASENVIRPGCLFSYPRSFGKISLACRGNLPQARGSKGSELTIDPVWRVWVEDESLCETASHSILWSALSCHESGRPAREAIFYADADRVEFLRNIKSGLPKIRGRSPTRRVELGRVIVFGNTSKSPVLYLLYQRET